MAIYVVVVVLFCMLVIGLTVLCIGRRKTVGGLKYLFDMVDVDDGYDESTDITFNYVGNSDSDSSGLDSITIRRLRREHNASQTSRNVHRNGVRAFSTKVSSDGYDHT